MPGVRLYGSDASVPLDALSYLRERYGIEPKHAPRRAKGAEVVLPEALHPWQYRGAEQLARGEIGGLLWAPGSGKSATLLAAAAAQGAKRVFIATRALGRHVFARDSLIGAPGRRIAIVVTRGVWSPGAVIAWKQAARAETIASYRAKGIDVIVVPGIQQALDAGAWAVVCSYETLAWQFCRPGRNGKPDVNQLRPELTLGWDVLIADESHRGKSKFADVTNVLHVLRGANRKSPAWISTGTLVRDRIRDAWGQLWFVDMDAWSNFYGFVRRHCDAHINRWGGLDTAGASNLEELRSRIKERYSILTKAEISTYLPQITREVAPIDVSGARRPRQYYVEKDFEDQLADAADLKFAAVVEEVFEEAQAGGKVVVVGNRRAWVSRFAGAMYDAFATSRLLRQSGLLLQATGEIPTSERQDIARRFLGHVGPAVFVATMDSISESIDLQDTDLLIFAALPFTPGQVVQMEGRVSRLGGSRPVRVRFLVAGGTIDEAIEERLLSKLDAVRSTGTLTEAQTLGSAVDEDEVKEGLLAWLREQASEGR